MWAAVLHNRVIIYRKKPEGIFHEQMRSMNSWECSRLLQCLEQSVSLPMAGGVE